MPLHEDRNASRSSDRKFPQYIGGDFDLTVGFQSKVIRKDKIVNQNLVDPVNTKVKGLLKGLRYISQIFDGEKEEQEMQIGFPTDVKHVAHIGCDGPSTLPSSGTTFENKETICSPRSASQEIPTGGDGTTPGSPKALHRTRRHASSESIGIPEAPKSPKSHRHARRHASESSAEGSRRSGRRSSKTGETSGSADNGAGSESPARDPPTAVPKQARRRKTKTGSDGGSTRSSARSKNPSFSDSDPGPEDKASQPVPAI